MNTIQIKLDAGDYCCICMDILQKPCILTCGGGHIVCKQCFYSNKCMCPLCRKTCTPILNKFMERVLDEINETGSCGNVFKRKDKLNHLKECIACCIKQYNDIEVYNTRLEKIIDELIDEESSSETGGDAIRQFLLSSVQNVT